MFYAYQYALLNMLSLAYYLAVKVVVFNTTFNNISVISWQSVLLMEETRVPGENTDLPQVLTN